jgi:hypothetical protein
VNLEFLVEPLPPEGQEPRWREPSSVERPQRVSLCEFLNSFLNDPQRTSCVR